MMGVGAKRALGLYRSCAPRHLLADGITPDVLRKLDTSCAHRDDVNPLDLRRNRLDPPTGETQHRVVDIGGEIEPQESDKSVGCNA